LWRRQIRELNNQLQGKSGEVSVLRSQVETKKREVIRIEAEKMALAQQMKPGMGGKMHAGANSEAHKQIAQIKASLNFKENELAEAKKRSTALEGEKQKAERRLEDVEATNHELKQELAETIGLQQASAASANAAAAAAAAAAASAASSPLASAPAEDRGVKLARRETSDAATQVAHAPAERPVAPAERPPAARRSEVEPAPRRDAKHVWDQGSAKRLRLIKTLLPEDQEESILGLVARGGGELAGGGGATPRVYSAVAGFVNGHVAEEELLAQLDAALRTGGGRDVRAGLESLQALLAKSASCRALVLGAAGPAPDLDAAMPDADAVTGTGSSARLQGDGASEGLGRAGGDAEGPLLDFLVRLALSHPRGGGGPLPPALLRVLRLLLSAASPEQVCALQSTPYTLHHTP
jgi:hypothetical protein